MAAKSSRSRWARNARSKPSRKLSPKAPNAASTSRTTNSTSSIRSTSARSLAAAIEKENFDLILTGLQSDDQGFGQTGVLLAELARQAARDDHHVDRSDRWPDETQARARSGMVSVGRAAAARRDHDSVRHQQAALRHAQGHHGARRKKRSRPSTARRWAWRTRRPQHVERIYVPQKTKKTEFITGSPKEAAAKLIEKLRHEARVLVDHENSSDHRAARRQVEQSQL